MPNRDDPHDFMTRDMKRTILKVRILVRVKSGKIYPYALIKEFEAMHFHKFIGPTIKNDIYNSLNALERSGYIRGVLKTEAGKTKKYYTITKRGTKASEALKKMHKMMLEYADAVLG